MSSYFSGYRQWLDVPLEIVAKPKEGIEKDFQRVAKINIETLEYENEVFTET